MTTEKKGSKKRNKKNKTSPWVALRWFFSTILTVICLLGILYGTVHLLSRTDGCRSLIEDKLEEQLGYPVAIESTATDSKLNLIIAGLLTDDFQKPGQPGYGVEMAIIDWSLMGLLLPDHDIIRSVTLKRANLSLVRDEKGAWSPEAFAPMAMWLAQWARFNVTGKGNTESMPTVAPAKKPSDKKKKVEKGIDQKAWEKINMELSGCGIRWWDEEGHELASAIGINIFSTPVDVPKRRLQHYRVEIEKAEAVGKQQADDLIFELLATQGHHILLCFNADWKPVEVKRSIELPPASKPLQQVVNPERLPLQPEYKSEPIPEVKPVRTIERAGELYDDLETDELIEQIRDVLQEALPDQEMPVGRNI